MSYPFSGSITALLTPFRDGRIDSKALRTMVGFQIEEGTNALVAVGTTGEAPTLTEAEQMEVISVCIDAAGGRVPVIAGTGSNCTRTTIERTLRAEEAGAAAALIVTPYYNRPTQDGLIAHFTAVHDATTLPVILYDVPARTNVSFSVETLAQLAQLPRIVGIKDATGNLGRVPQITESCGEDFIQLCGDDDVALAHHAAGGRGCISVTSNLAPHQCAELHAALQRGDYTTARRLDARFQPLNHALFLESSPAPCKYGASQLGLCTEELRLPLVPVRETTAQAMCQAMTVANVFSRISETDQTGRLKSAIPGGTSGRWTCRPA